MEVVAEDGRLVGEAGKRVFRRGADCFADSSDDGEEGVLEQMSVGEILYSSCPSS